MRHWVPAILSLLLALAAGAAACKSASSSSPPDPCSILFGRPNAETGLGPEQCQPSCSCGGSTFAPPDYDDAFIQALVDDWVPAVAYAPLTTDPYGAPAPPDDPPEMVCGVLPMGSSAAKPRPYALVTYGSQSAAAAAGADVTHFGHCGVCSTLSNLAVYMRNNDLTAPVRSCGFSAAPDGGTVFDGDVDCLMALGFDLPCAQAWAYDTQNTRSSCLSVCLANLSAPYNLPDGGTNPCISCDEAQSGPIFKAVAGRTRRNSGLPNAICRPCSEVQPLVHSY
ncbi:MAG TPA: hypothetical protein VMK42_20105 [Anaeromyxobacteraceae bacterium]|nr:hypothetical protein [Anaeromyxobacteraceae bacterium]